VKLPDGVEKYTFEDAVKDAEERAEGVALTAARLQGAEAKEEEVEQKQDNALEENEDEEEVVSQFELSDEEGLAAGDVGGGADGAGDAYFLSWGDGVWRKGYERALTFAVPSARATVKHMIALFEEDCGWSVALVARKAHGSDESQFFINFAADDQQVRDLLPELHYIAPAGNEPEHSPPDIVGTWCLVVQRSQGWDASPACSVVASEDEVEGRMEEDFGDL
jgi:hypothetical protein